MSGAVAMFGSPKKTDASPSSFNNPLSRPSSVMSNGYIGVTTPGASAVQDEADAEFAGANQALTRQASEKLGDVFALKTELRNANDPNNNPKMRHHVSLKFGTGTVPGVGVPGETVQVVQSGNNNDDLDDLDLGAFEGGNESVVNSPTGDENTTFGFDDDDSMSFEDDE